MPPEPCIWPRCGATGRNSRNDTQRPVVFYSLSSSVCSRNEQCTIAQTQTFSRVSECLRCQQQPRSPGRKKTQQGERESELLLLLLLRGPPHMMLALPLPLLHRLPHRPSPRRPAALSIPERTRAGDLLAA